jgi:hypothetical protein
MKLTMLSTFTVLLVATLAAPAAAATTLLAPGSHIADVIKVDNAAICGRILVSQTGTGSIVFSADYQAISATNCNTGLPTGTLISPARFDLCRLDVAQNRFLIKVIEDTNVNGKIDGLEGMFKGLLVSGDNAMTFELFDSNLGLCNGNVIFRTGYKRP